MNTVITVAPRARRRARAINPAAILALFLLWCAFVVAPLSWGAR